MKKISSGLIAMSLLTVISISGCSVHTREYNRRPPRRDRHRHDDHRNDRRDDHYDRRF